MTPIMEDQVILAPNQPGRTEFANGYDIFVPDMPTQEGIRLPQNPRVFVDSFNLVDVDLSSEEAVNSLNDKYPLAWAESYPNTVFVYSADSAPKLAKAVELYLYIHAGEDVEANLIYPASGLIGDVEIRTIESPVTSQLPYSDFMINTKWSEYRIPLDVLYSRDFRTLPNIAPYYYDKDGNAVEITQVNIVVDSNPLNGPGYVFKDSNGNNVTVHLSYLDADGNGIPAYVPMFAPLLLDSARKMGSKYFGSPLTNHVSDNGEALGYSSAFLEARSYQIESIHFTSPFDWGGEFSAGKHTF